MLLPVLRKTVSLMEYVSRLSDVKIGHIQQYQGDDHTAEWRLRARSTRCIWRIRFEMRWWHVQAFSWEHESTATICQWGLALFSRVIIQSTGHKRVFLQVSCLYNLSCVIIFWFNSWSGTLHLTLQAFLEEKKEMKKNSTTIEYFNVNNNNNPNLMALYAVNDVDGCFRKEPKTWSKPMQLHGWLTVTLNTLCHLGYHSGSN